MKIVDDPQLPIKEQKAEAEIERLRAALKPFAACAHDRDHLPGEWDIRVALWQCRLAREALTLEQKGEPSEVTVRRMRSEEWPDRQEPSDR